MQFDFQKWAKAGPLLFGAVLVTACSNSSAPPPPPVNQAPTVQAGDDIVSDEKLDIALSANATDSDGSISSYAWAQTSGTEVTLTGADSSSIEFTAPIAKVEETLVFEVTATDNEGATASDSVSVTINPVNEIAFQIQGLVWDGGAVPSDISADFGGDIVVATTDADGNYVIDIAADEDAASELLFLRSDSTADPEIAFANIPATLQSLVDASGGDGVLDSAEEIGVNLTPLSTAFYGMIVQNADSIASEDDVRTAITTADGNDGLSLGTSLKIISENNSAITDRSVVGLSDINLGLPDGFDDTIQFAIDPLAIRDFIRNLQANEPTAFADSRAVMLGDENIVQAANDTFTAFPVTLTMSLSNFVISRVTLNGDGTALFSEGGPEITAEWAQDADGVVTITGQNGNPIIERESFPSRLVNGSFIQVREVLIFNSVVMTPLVDLPVGTLYSEYRDITRTFPDNASDLPPEDASRTVEVTFVEDQEYKDIDLDALFDGNSQIDILTSFFQGNFNPVPTGIPGPFGERQFHYNADSLTFDRSGTATSGNVTSAHGSDFFSNGRWELEDSKTLKVSFDSDRFNLGDLLEISYGLINNNLSTVEARQNGIVEGLSNGAFAVFDSAQTPSTEADVLGFYTIAIGLSGQLSWTELKAGGETEIVNLIDQDQDGVVEQNEVFTRGGFWVLNTDGTITMSEYRFPVTRQPNCNPNIEPVCVLSRETNWSIANRDGSEIYVLNRLGVYFPSANDPNTSELVFDQFTARTQDFSTTAPVDLATLPPG